MLTTAHMQKVAVPNAGLQGRRAGVPGTAAEVAAGEDMLMQDTTLMGEEGMVTAIIYMIQQLIKNNSFSRLAFLFCCCCFCFKSTAQQAKSRLEKDYNYTAELLGGGIIEPIKLVLPQEVSLKPYCPFVLNQEYETCFAYATAYAGRSVSYNASHDLTGFDKMAFSPGFIVHLCQPRNRFSNRHCARSGHIADACLALHQSGTVPIDLYPHECSCKPVKRLMAEAAKYRTFCYVLFNVSDTISVKTYAVKAAISQKKPVVVAFLDFASFDSSFGKQTWKWSQEEKATVDTATIFHTACIVGYSDTVNNGSFEIMNSWGGHWGKDGFIWISYEDLLSLTSVAIAIEEKKQD